MQRICQDESKRTKLISCITTKRMQQGNLVFHVIDYRTQVYIDSFLASFSSKVTSDEISKNIKGNSTYYLKPGIYDIGFRKSKYGGFVCQKVPISDTTTIVFELQLGPNCSEYDSQFYNGTTW